MVVRRRKKHHPVCNQDSRSDPNDCKFCDKYYLISPMLEVTDYLVPEVDTFLDILDDS
jgi:hypothetical protein